MKNHDLIELRGWAGFTQSDAAELLRVDRATYNRWESGKRPMPSTKWKRFQKEVAALRGPMPPKIDERPDAPADLQYDVRGRPIYTTDGYPLGFDHGRYENSGPDGNWDLEGEDASLRTIEGAEHEERRCVRFFHAVLNRASLPEETLKKYCQAYDEGDDRLWHAAHALDALVRKGVLALKDGCVSRGPAFDEVGA